MKYSAKTDKGNVREKNEDSYSIIYGQPGIPATFIVADGMGGHNSGEIASKTAVDSISNTMIENPGIFSDACNAEEEIKRLILAANKAVYDKSLEAAGNHGMGTTLILAVVIEKKMYIGHVGDSRLYMIHNSVMSQITTDHSYIEELIRNGSLTKEEGAKHPKKNIITRALGCFDKLDVDTYTCELETNDSLIICTDGLTNMLDEEGIRQTVTENTPSDACEDLILKALKNGGEDNITVIVIKNE